MTTARVKEILKVTDPTARAALGVLESAGLIQEVSGRRWGRQYLARAVLKAIEAPRQKDTE
jgi:Fic family protein